MTHDPTKILLGATNSSEREVDSLKGYIEAGLFVRLDSDGEPSLAKADGSLLGVSLGKDLSGTDFTAVCRRGLGVPVQLTDEFTPVIGAQVAASDTTGKAIGYTGSGNTYVNAKYVSGVLTGIKEDKTTCRVALIDFEGGL